MNKVGKKILIILAGLLTITIALWLRWSSSMAEVVRLFAADLAIGQTVMSLLLATAIGVFQTSVRLV